jgi:hypothetical protein
VASEGMFRSTKQFKQIKAYFPVLGYLSVSESFLIKAFSILPISLSEGINLYGISFGAKWSSFLKFVKRKK